MNDHIAFISAAFATSLIYEAVKKIAMPMMVLMQML